LSFTPVFAAVAACWCLFSARLWLQEEPPSTDLSDEAIHRAEIELAGMFSGVIGAVMSNVMRERPDLLGSTATPTEDL
jgi:hypothetical protein